MKAFNITEGQKKKLKIFAALVGSITGGYLLIRVISPTKVGETIKASISKAMEHSLVEKNGYSYSYVIAVNEDIIPISVFKDLDSAIAKIMVPYLEAVKK